MFKLLAMLMAFLLVALMLLSLRQRRLELTAETSQIYSKIRDAKETLLDGKVDIAKKSSPTALATALQNSGVDTGGPARPCDRKRAQRAAGGGNRSDSPGAVRELVMDATKRTQWIASTVLIGTAALLSGLLGRVLWIQKHISSDMVEKLNRQVTAVIKLTPERGTIVTGGGDPLAMSVRVYNLFADPAFIMDPSGKLNPLSGKNLQQAQDQLLEALAPLVNKPAKDLKFDLEQNVFYKREVAPGVWEDTDKPRRFLWLAKEVDDDFYSRFMALKEDLRQKSQEVLKTDGKSKVPAVRTAAAEKAAMLYHTLDGVGFVRSMKRVYPMGTLASSVVGFANKYEGIDGMEHQLDPMLMGIDGKMFVTKDAQRNTLLVQDERFVPADNGRTVWLTLDTIVQNIAEQEAQAGGDGSQGGQRDGDCDGSIHGEDCGAGELSVV